MRTRTGRRAGVRAPEKRFLINYCWDQVGGGEDGKGLHKHPEMQETMKRLLAQLKAITPALVTPGRVQFRVPGTRTDIYGMFCYDPEARKNYVILANPTKNPMTVTVKHEKLKGVTEIKNKFGNDIIVVKDSAFDISFEKYGTAVYEWNAR